MRIADWIVFFGFLGYVVWDGVRRGRGNRSGDDYFLAGRSVPWWGVGLSIMATQASAITMIGTSGQGWLDGFRFVQFYFALPLAMLILAVTLVPAYHRSRVTTAYEFLGARFDRKTRTLGALLFLLLRGLSVGFVIYAPSLVLSKVFALPFTATVLVMGSIAVTYTAIGGLGAVIATDVKQMAVMVLGLIVALVMLVRSLPADIGLAGAWHLADATGHLKVVDWRWDPTEKYTVWSSLIGGLFLFLSYFGTDQSQAQRLLASRSLVGHPARAPVERSGQDPLPVCRPRPAACSCSRSTLPAPRRSPSIRTRSGKRPPSSGFEAAEYAEIYPASRGRASRPVQSRGPRARRRSRSRARRAVSTGACPRAGESRRARELRGGIADTHYVFLDFILDRSRSASRASSSPPSSPPPSPRSTPS